MKIKNSWNFFLEIILRDNFNYLKKKGEKIGGWKKCIILEYLDYQVTN